MLDAVKSLNWKYGSNIGSTLKFFDLYNFFRSITSVADSGSISFCNTFIKSHWSAKLVLTALNLLPIIFLIVPNGLLTPSDWPELSGSFLEASLNFFVGSVSFFFKSKSLALLIA